MSKFSTINVQTVGYDNIKTAVVNNESEMERVLRLLFSIIEEKSDEHSRFKRVVGFGIEKSFSSSTIDGVVTEKVAVLKLCAEDFCVIVHLLHFKKIPTSLHKFLDVSDIILVGFGIKQNLCDLRRDYGIQCRNVVVELADLAPAVKEHSTASLYTLVDLCNYLFLSTTTSNLAKSADVTFGDWGGSLLSDEQITYATREVCATFMVGKYLYDGLHFL